jgi:hypothetical protein
MTIDAYPPRGAWTAEHFGMDASLSNQIAIPSGTSVKWWVLYTDIVLWHALTPYWRSYLVRLPLPGYSLGGVVLNSSAIQQYHPRHIGYGGIEVGGSTIRIVARHLVASGGVEVGGLAQMYRVYHQLGSGGDVVDGSAISTVIHPLVGSGGVEVNGGAIQFELHSLWGSGGVILDSTATKTFTPGSISPSGPPFTIYASEDITSPPGVTLVPNAGQTLYTGQLVFVEGLVGNPGGNGFFNIIVLSPAVFNLVGSIATMSFYIEPSATCTPY